LGHALQLDHLTVCVVLRMNTTKTCHCLQEDRSMSSKFVNYFRLNNRHYLEDLYDHARRKRVFMSIMNKFSCSSKNNSKNDSGRQFKICESSHTNHVLRVSYPRIIECKNKNVRLTPAYTNVNVPNSVAYLVRSLIFKWHVFRCESQNGHEKTCVQKENGLHAQDLLTILSSTVNIIRKTHLIIS
jgi:hypothetical protein